jgi:hypothetical protein
MADGLPELGLESPSPSRRSVVDDSAPTTDENPPRLTTTPPVQWLRPLAQYGVILCAEYQSCYTPGSNLREHLLRKHAVKGKRTKEIESWVAAQNIAVQVTHPPDNSPFIHGLQFRDGWLCEATSCLHRCASRQNIERHCSKEHGVDTRRRQKERKMYKRVVLQYLFAKAD